MFKRYLAAVLLLSALAISGCAALLPDPMQKAEVTMAPGVTAQLHSPLASDANRDEKSVTLYFRYGREPMLAAEARVLSISSSEPEEKVLVQALLDGPGAGSTELGRLFPEQVQVLNTVPQGDVLYVTFSEALLRPYADEPTDWQEREDWRRESALRRKLAMAGLTASITENFPYQRVQVLVQQRGGVSSSLRLENAYFRDPSLPVGLAQPFHREESLLLTQRNTAFVVLSAWRQKDWGRLYLYVAASNPQTDQPRPSMEAAFVRWDQAASLMDFSVSGGSVSHDGCRAVISADVLLARADEPQIAVEAYPLALRRDKGIWKITYEQLTALMDLLPAKEARQ